MKAGWFKRAEQGQSTVEFSIAIVVLLSITLGIMDAARAVFQAHNLSRAAEVMATDLKSWYELNAQSNIYPTALTSAIFVDTSATPLSDSAGVSSGSFNPVWNASRYTIKEVDGFGGALFQYMSNSSDNPIPARPGLPSIYVCGVPNLTTPSYIQVTLTGQFTPVSSYFIGGRTITINETATVETTAGEAASNSGSLAGSSVCTPLN